MANKVTKETMKEINEKLLLREIYFSSGINRATLSKKTSLSPATVTYLVGDLLEKNLIVETGVTGSTGGRKPIQLEINADHKCIMGIKIGLGYIDFMLTDLMGNTLKHTKNIYGEKFEPDFVLSELIKIWNEWKYINIELLGIGVAVSGVVDSKFGIVVNSYLLEWKKVELKKMINEVFDVRTIILNDVDSFALAQLWKGMAWKHSNSIFMTLGVGIGGAMIINGKLHTSHGGVGEFGHMTVKMNGKRCNCGSHGCLEAEASFMVLANRVHAKTSSKELNDFYKTLKTTESSELQYLEKAVIYDEKVVQCVFKEYSEIIGIALKNLINIFAPQYLLLGGEAMRFEKYFYEDTINIAKENAFAGLADNVIFDKDSLGDSAWTYGCIYEIIEKELFLPNSK